MTWLIGFIASKLGQAFAPVVAQRTVSAFTAADWLADVEADHEVWACQQAGCSEPLADWGQQLLDDITLSDELWAAHHNLTDPAKSPLAGVSVTPTAAVDASATDSGGGGHPQLRDELIEELVEEYRTKLYKWFR